MAIAGILNVLLGANTKGFVDGMDKASKKTKSFSKELKATLGEESGIGQFGKALRGAGLVAGLTVSARALTDMIKTIDDMTDRFREGKITASEFAGEIGRSIPVLGEFFKLGEAIFNLFASPAPTFGAQFFAMREKYWDDVRRMVDDATRMEQEAAVLATPAGLDRDLLRERFKFVNQIALIEAQIKQAEKDNDQAKIIALERQRNAAEAIYELTVKEMHERDKKQADSRFAEISDPARLPAIRIMESMTIFDAANRAGGALQRDTSDPGQRKMFNDVGEIKRDIRALREKVN